MAIREECLANFKGVYDGTRFAFIARQHLGMGHIPKAEENIAHIKYCLEGMKDTEEYNQAMDLVGQALKYAKTKPDMAIGYLIDVEPLIEQGALQKAVNCECGETRERRREFMEARSKYSAEPSYLPVSSTATRWSTGPMARESSLRWSHR